MMPPLDLRDRAAIRRAVNASLAAQGERATAARIMADKTPCTLTDEQARAAAARLMKGKKES